MKSYHNYTKPSPKVSCNWHRKLSTADKRDKAIARGISETATNNHKKILEKYSITSDIDGTWIVVMKAKTEKHYDVPVHRSNTINDAIEYAHYFDRAYNA